MPMADKAND